VLQDGAIASGLFNFFPGYTIVGLVVWLLVILGVIGLLFSLFRQ